MDQNRKFKLKFDELREGNPAKKDGQNPAEPESETAFYDTPSPARNLCLEWENGRKMLLNYAYLVSVELVPDQE